jgi:FeS assembly SUF system protein
VLTEQITAALRTVHDPEIPVNIYDLGLIYRADLQPVAGGQYDLTIDMTLTAPNCPVADTIPTMVRQAVLGIPGLGEVTVNLVWDPPWDKSRMSDAARLQLDMF